jgi:uncharacterized RDD family membrane protein YckC
MSEREPAVRRDEPAAAATPAAAAALAAPTGTSASTAEPDPPVLQRPTRGREAPSVYVVGFWKRLAAGLVDFFVILPVAMLITFIVSKVADVRLPARNIKLLDIDMWIDLVLATNSALVMGLVLFLAIALTYLLVFHITLGRTLGMHLLKMKVIDIYGDPPSPARCAARCAGYLAGVATLFLGFLWIGFDHEKRGLQDWIAGTYVIRV